MKILIELTKDDLSEEAKKKHPENITYHDFLAAGKKLTMDDVNRADRINFQTGQGTITLKNRK
jgi:hypothetical protein